MLAPVALVLVVDDLDLIRKLATRYLEQAGHMVIQANNGTDAIKVYQEKRPDCVLLDLVMPGLDGLATLRGIKGFDSHARVAMFTADADVKQVGDALQYGARDYVVKPFRPERLLEAIDRLMEAK
jgi:two-component system chemotaxis response regulator CheY